MKMTYQEYELKSVLAETKIARVALHKHKISKEKVVIKTLMKNEIKNTYTSKDVRNNVLLEGRCLIELNKKSPYIVEYYDIEDTAFHLHIFQEYIDGSMLVNYLGDLRRSGITPQIDEYLNLFIQLAKGLEFLHSHNIVHKDIKPDNIMVYFDELENIMVKYIDFGYSFVLNNPLYKRPNCCGTLLYFDPNCLEINEPSDFDHLMSDIYSLGITFFCIITLKAPYNLPLGNDEILRRKMTDNFIDPCTDNEEVNLLIKSMTARHPISRPDISTVVKVIEEIQATL